MIKIAGIDYGSKLAGTTVIAFEKEKKIHFLQSQKKQDADQFILQEIQRLSIKLIFLDAPLSLPLVYSNPSAHGDYFYRAVDKELKAMSPMFLGGLTARAMRLKSQLNQLKIEVKETYPAYTARKLQLADFQYKKQKTHLQKCSEFLLSQLALPYSIQPIENWHQMDALLAFNSAWRYQNGAHERFGEEVEGAVFV